MNLIIIQANSNYKDILENRFDESEDYEVVGSTDNGETGVNLIAQKKPDIVILDVVLPKLDGFGVMDKVRKMHLKNNPIMIVVSRINNENIVQAALKRGASYYFIRPVNLSLMELRIKEIFEIEQSTRAEKHYREDKVQYIRVNEEDTKYNREAIVTNLMHEIGMPSHLSGSKFLTQAVLIATQDKSKLNAITKCIYPQVAKHNKTTTQRVERAMRNAISNVWAKKHSRLMDKMFETEVLESKRPTIGEFIALMSDKVIYENEYINWQEKPSR